MLLSFLVLSLTSLGSVLTLEGWKSEDGDWPRSTQHNLHECETPVHSEHATLDINDLTSVTELHFHLDTQVEWL